MLKSLLNTLFVDESDTYRIFETSMAIPLAAVSPDRIVVVVPPFTSRETVVEVQKYRLFVLSKVIDCIGVSLVYRTAQTPNTDILYIIFPLPTTYRFSLESNARRVGLVIVDPVKFSLSMVPPIFTRRILLFPVSAIYKMFPRLILISLGEFSLAEVAAEPSPVDPVKPSVPA